MIVLGFQIRKVKKPTPRSMVGLDMLRSQLAAAQEDVRRLSYMLAHPDEPLQ